MQLPPGPQLSPGTLSPGSRKFSVGGFSPVGLHVLVVDDDPLCLMVLERMLRQCNYNVTMSNRVSHALQLLRERKDEFDLVMSDVYMPDEDGFKLLEVIGLELDLPVIMMSANGETSVVMQGITHGACDYLIKPIRIEELRNIWQHVIRRKGKEMQRGSMQGELDEISRGTESQDQCSRKRKDFFEMEDCSMADGINNLKKARVNWSIELHRQFVDAVNELGIDKAVPKRILDIMNVQGLTRENVASHLQKYRLYLKRLSGVVPEPCPIASFQASGDGLTGGAMLVQPAGKAPLPNAGVKGRNLGAGIGTGVGKDKKIDTGTMESLARYKLHQQRHAANRAQVLGGLGLSDTRSSSDYPAVGLHRMCSLDLKLFLQDSSTAQSADVLDDLAACSFRTVKLEDDMAMASGRSVSGVNNKRTYPSRQSAANQGRVSGQWSNRAVDTCEEQKHEKIGAISGANELNLTTDTVFCGSGNFDKVMDNMIADKVGGSSNVGLNQGSDLQAVACGTTLRDNEGIQFSSGYNAGMLNTTSVGLHKAMEGNQHQFLQSVGIYGPASAVTYTSSLVDLADDAVSSTNAEASTSSFTDNSGDAFSESSFSAIAQLGGILSPEPPPSSSHLVHNSELDISDYLQLDDGFGF